MPSRQVEYWIMVKPLHPIYNVPVPGLGRLSRSIVGVPDGDIETMYFRKTIVSCTGGGCGFSTYPVEQPVWGLFEVCYNIEQLRIAYKRVLKQWDSSNVKVLQRISYETFARN